MGQAARFYGNPKPETSSARGFFARSWCCRSSADRLPWDSLNKLLVGAIVLFLVLVPIPSSAQPAVDSSTSMETLSATPTELKAGEDVAVAGSGCAPENQVRFELYDPQLSSATQTFSGTDGAFMLTVHIPASAKIGRNWLRASCLSVDAKPRIMEAVLLVKRPQFEITRINLFLGLGTALMFFGIGLLSLRDPTRSRRSRSR
jgi:hypothetical protein